MLKLPEMYGALALAHAADIEADRLYERLLRKGDKNRLYIYGYSISMAELFHEYIHKMVHKDWGGLCPDVAYPGRPESSEKWGGILEGIDNARWQLRSLWSSCSSRLLAGLLLDPHIRECGLSEHDARILVWYVAEHIYTGTFYRIPSILRGHTPPFLLQGNTPILLAMWTAASLYDRWSGADRWTLVLHSAIGRVLFHLWVYRSLWGRYRDWESLWSLENPAKAKAVVEAAINAHNARAREARQRAKSSIKSDL